MISGPKLNNILLLYPMTLAKAVKTGFYPLADHVGWSNGFMADLTDEHIKEIEATAVLKQSPRYRFSFQKDKGPKIAKLLEPSEVPYDVEDVEFDLEQLAVVLLAPKKENILIDPPYLSYFLSYYGTNLTLRAVKWHESVKVFQDDRLIGLIMPKRSKE